MHVLRGDSEDPVGDFIAINQELELFNPKLADKLQVVVVNKIDIPEVRDKLEDLTKQVTPPIFNDILNTSSDRLID